MAAGSDGLKQDQCGITDAQTACACGGSILRMSPLTGALVLVNQGVELPDPRWNGTTSPLEFPCCSFNIQPSSFIRSLESAKRPKPAVSAPQLLTLSPWRAGNVRPFGCQCLCLSSRVSLWAPKAKPLIGHGSSITQSNPFHPRSHPNSQEDWEPWNGRYVS